MEINLENKKYIINELKLMDEDLNNCKSQQTRILLTDQVSLFEKELLKYRKPMIVEPPLRRNKYHLQDRIRGIF